MAPRPPRERQPRPRDDESAADFFRGMAITLPLAIVLWLALIAAALWIYWRLL